MTASGNLEIPPDPREEDPVIILRLSDILSRVPAHLLKPGPHDATSQVRFSVEELADKIARGRVSVPLARLAAAFPDVFRASDEFDKEHEIQLPLQKLLEQVGLTRPKSAGFNDVPDEQVERARAEASRILQGDMPAAPSPPATAGTPADASAAPAPEQQPAAPVHPLNISKMLGTAWGIFGRRPRAGEPAHEAADKPTAGPAEATGPRNPPGPQSSPPATPGPSPQPPPAVQLELSPQAPPRPSAPPAPAGYISLRAAPIFHLLPARVLRPGAALPEDARVSLPLAIIDPQLAGGHVEIPIEDFTKALPEALRGTVQPVPETRVWIPLDEIFQNLPQDHLFYMPPLDAYAESPPPAVPPAVNQEPKPAWAPITRKIPAAEAPAPVETPAFAEAKAPAEAPLTPEVAASLEEKPMATETAPAANGANSPHSEAAAVQAPDPANAEPVHGPDEDSAAAPQPSRAPWMHGFRVPPPRLFSSGAPTADLVLPQPAAAEPLPTPAGTPEAKRTADFLAGQPGIFASAAFVQGAVFASEDFPRKPDLDALRDFMGAFIHSAQESGKRLGWNRVVTMACEQFHLTAVVRDSHFVVALHHDRVLPSVLYEALITAADDLGRATA